MQAGLICSLLQHTLEVDHGNCCGLCLYVWGEGVAVCVGVVILNIKHFVGPCLSFVLFRIDNYVSPLFLIHHIV
jgi:hypothetical protein